PMGAAGLTCSTSETASKATTGMEIDILKVPRREAGMTAYEVMLSESQERMLAICKKGAEDRVAGVFRKWGLNAVVIGHVTGDGLVRIKEGDTVAAEMPANALTDLCPTYRLDAEEPAYIGRAQSVDPLSFPEPTNYGDVLRELLASPSIADKLWVTEQYDSMVQTQTCLGPGAGDAAVLRVRGSKKGIAVKTDGNGRYCLLDPFVGGQIAVMEAARNVVCVGAQPTAVTDCLNFGSPERPTVFWQFKRAVEGIAAATEALGIPVVSGNVSFYNETPDGAVHPTPVIGMLGILDDPAKRRGLAFAEEGDAVVLLRADEDPLGGLGGSEYLAVVHEVELGRPPAMDMEAEIKFQKCLLWAIRQGLIVSAHDCSDGGLAVCLAECAIGGSIGASVLLRYSDWPPLPPSAILFGEAQSRAVVTVRGDAHLKRLEKLAADAGIRAQWVGTVGSDRLRISLDGELVVDEDVPELRSVHSGAIPALMSDRKA
ncbi:MAG: phosphoribosylformylglycinamidine synthase II, partial [Armatimonadetes bacterium]|nr:phosphoribosylformylglycinamidine synthase II [Armatimonadota bacterium]